MQRAAHTPLAPLIVQPVCFLERPPVDGHRGVQRILEIGNALEVLLHDLTRGDATLPHRLLHLGEASLHH